LQLRMLWWRVNCETSHEAAKLAGADAAVAATDLLTWSHPGRIRNEAEFAALAGASPLYSRRRGGVAFRPPCEHGHQTGATNRCQRTRD
jgi:hypothetical protein